MLRLMPMVALDPGALARRYAAERPQPAADAPAEAWDAWFFACLGDAGIRDLRPMRPRSWHVLIEQLVQTQTLERLLEARFGTAKIAEVPAYLRYRLLSGVVLADGEELLVEPTCCSDVGCLHDWERAAAERHEEWKMLWIGHPWRSTRQVGDNVEISQSHEEEPPVTELSFKAVDFANAVRQARQELQALAGRLQLVLAARGHPESEALAGALVSID